MPRQSKDTVAVLGIDIGKNSFHLIGLDKRGAIVLRQKLSRGQLEARLANMPPCLIGMEACVGAHHLSRKLKALGHDAETDAGQVCEGLPQGQQERLPRCGGDRRSRAAPDHALRCHQDRRAARPAGVAPGALTPGQRAYGNRQRDPRLPARPGHRGRQGLHRLRAALPGILATRTDVLSPRLLHLIEDLIGDWRHLDERIDNVSLEIGVLAQEDAGCERLMTVPGIGPIISSATVAAIGTGDVFCKGRDFGAWLGLVPKQISTGDRTILGKISKRGNKYLQDAVRASRSRRPAEARQLGALRPQALDRGRSQAASPQRAGDRARQQAGAHRLERAASRPQLRGQENVRSHVPTRVSLAPCSALSRPSPSGGPEPGQP